MPPTLLDPQEQRPIDPPEVNRAFVFLTKPLGLAPHQAEGLSLRLGGPSTDRDKKSENYSWSSRVRSHAATRCLAWRTASGVISRSLPTVWDASPRHRPCRSKAVRVLPSNWPRACRIRSMTYSGARWRARPDLPRPGDPRPQAGRGIRVSRPIFLARACCTHRSRYPRNRPRERS